MYGGGGFGFGYQSPQDTDPFTPGVQRSPYDHDPTRPGIQAAGSVTKVPHLSSPYDTDPYRAGTQTGYGGGGYGNQYQGGFQQPPQGLANGLNNFCGTNNTYGGVNTYGGIRR